MYQRHTANAATGVTPSAGGPLPSLASSSSTSNGGSGGGIVTGVPVAVAANHTATTAIAADPSAVRKRRRVVRKAGKGLFGGAGFHLGPIGGVVVLPPRLRRFLRAVLTDEDLMVSLIQATSIVILAGCAVTLLVHYAGMAGLFGGEAVADDGDDGDDDGSTKLSGFSAWFPSILSTATSWMFKPSFTVAKRESVRKANGLFKRRDFPPSRIYTVPDSLSFVGDKSDRYARLRMRYDHLDLPDVPRKYTFETMPMTDRERDGETFSSALPPPYDIYNCPSDPPKDYPYNWNLLELLHHWPPDDPTVPQDAKIYQGLCVFDYERDYTKAMRYREAELPFVVQNDPQVRQTVKRWNAPGYMEELLGFVQHRAEYSESNHFLYWNRPKGYRPERPGGSGARAAQRRLANGRRNPMQAPEADPNGLENWKEPTKMMRMTYPEWLSHANLTENGQVVGPDDPHWYFRLIGCGETGPQGECDKGSSEYLFDELPYFQPKETLYMVDPMEQKGIHCRFGMNGVIAENHFDQSRNAIVVLGGERRYVLAHPNQCPLLSLLPKGHPSARHSAVDWSDPDLHTYPEFAHARGNEVVLQPGDVLYLPTNWFHYIISLSLNFQCNSRSGLTQQYMIPIRECGF